MYNYSAPLSHFHGQSASSSHPRAETWRVPRVFYHFLLHFVVLCTFISLWLWVCQSRVPPGWWLERALGAKTKHFRLARINNLALCRLSCFSPIVNLCISSLLQLQSCASGCSVLPQWPGLREAIQFSSTNFSSPSLYFLSAYPFNKFT